MTIQAAEPKPRPPDARASNHAPPVLVATDLRMSYGPRRALRGLSFSLQAGHILGFLGPNGAGKTTAIRILTTILEPSSGSFTLAGIASDQPERIRQKIGVLPESFGFPKQMTGLEYVTYYARLYGWPADEAKAQGLRLLAEVGLEQRARSLIGSFSRGMRQRIGIARALVNEPAVVVLDEPTLGLDPRGQQELLNLVRRIARERNAGIILCSHALSEIESICDEVVILSEGQVIAAGTVSDVIGGAQQNRVRLRVPAGAVAAARDVLATVGSVANVKTIDATAGWLAMEVSPSTNGNPPDGPGAATYHSNNTILKALLGAEIPILNFETTGGRLQEVFLHLTGEATR